MSDAPANLPKDGTLLKWDGTIPAWGIILLGVAWIGYSWSNMQEMKTKLTTLEVSVVEYRKKVDTLEIQQRDGMSLIARMTGDVQVVKELMIRLEKRLDPPSR